MLKITLIITLVSLNGCFFSIHKPEHGIAQLAHTSHKDSAAHDLSDQTATLRYRLEQSGAFHNDQEFNEITSRIISKLPLNLNGIKPKAQLVRNPSINAFSLYDGTICVNSGLVARLTNPDQLAFVLAHEAAHWTLQHGLARYRTTTNTLLLAQLADTLVTPLASRFKLKAVAERGIDLASLTSFSIYSQELELEADKIGIEAMTNAGYNPLKALSVLRLLKSSSTAEDASSSEHFISNHPDTDQRLALMEEELAKTEKITRGDIAEIDPRFIRKTADIRLANASWAYRAGYFIEALNNLRIMELALTDRDRSHIRSRLHLEKAAIYLAMARDLSFVKTTIDPTEWKQLYHTRRDEDVRLEWCREGFKNLDKVRHPSSLVKKARETKAVAGCDKVS